MIRKSHIKATGLLGPQIPQLCRPIRLTSLKNYVASALAPTNFHIAMVSGKPPAKRAKRQHHSTHQRHSHQFPKKRVDVIRSGKYKANGTASYLYALRKYKFNPP